MPQLLNFQHAGPRDDYSYFGKESLHHTRLQYKRAWPLGSIWSCGLGFGEATIRGRCLFEGRRLIEEIRVCIYGHAGNYYLVLKDRLAFCKRTQKQVHILIKPSVE